MILKAVFAAIVSLSFSVLFRVRGRNTLYAGMNGGIGYFVYLAAASFGEPVAMLLSSAVMTLIAEMVARLRKSPATLFLVAGLIPIVPGGSIYNCILTALEGLPNEAASIFYYTLLQSGAIAVGIIVASSMAKLVPAARHP